MRERKQQTSDAELQIDNLEFAQSRDRGILETSHQSEGSGLGLRLGLGLGLGVKGYLYYIIFYYTLKTNTRQFRTSEPSD